MNSSPKIAYSEPQPAELLPAHTVRLRSESVGDEIEVTVVLPGEASPGERFPVLYVLDPTFDLLVVAGVTRMLHTFAAMEGVAYPNHAVVGIGYPGANPTAVMGLRTRDLTPKADGFPDEFAVDAPHGSGCAHRFLACIKDEIFPLLETRFPIRSSMRTLVGHSFGGLFGLYTLFHEPTTFARYLLVSPSIWWGQRAALRFEAAWAAGHDDLPAKVFLAVGEAEQVAGDSWLNEGIALDDLHSLRLVDNLQELTRLLERRQYVSLSLNATLLPDEHHLTVLPAALTRGLVWLYDAG